MATAYTSLLGLALPVTGEISGTWGDTVNNAITSLLDSAVAGTTTLSTDADVTLTTTTGATNQARQAILLCSGARTAIRNITAPAQSKMYVVINNTTGGYGVVIRGAGPTTGVTVANGKTAVVVWNGSDFVEVAPAVATNLSGGTAGALPYQSGAGATTFLSIGTNNFVLTSNGTAPVWTTNTGTGNVVRATSPTIDAPTITTSLSASAPIFTTGTISSNAASRLGLQANEIWSWGANASTQGTVTFRLRSSDGSLGSSPVAITSAGMDVTGALTASTSARSPIIIGGTGTTSTLALRSTSGVGTTGADIIFQTGNNGATEAMRILNSGNVGIGTSSPAQLLHVLGTSTKALIATSSSTGFASVQTQSDGGTNDLEIVQYGTAATSTYFGVNRAGAAFLGASATTFGMGTKGASPVILATNNTERLRIDSSGNVGIGTNNPSIRLHVENAAGSYNSTADNNVALYLKSSSAAATNNFQGIQFAALSGNSNNSAFTIGISSPATGYSPDLIFSQRTGVSTWVERMHIDSSGNVGIGTTSPSVRLHATATGASATEIARIQNTTTTGGAAALLSIGDTWGGVYHPVYIGADYFSYGMRFQTNRDAAGFGFVFRNAADTVSVLSIDTSTNAVTIPGQVLLGSGSASNPSLSVSGDTNTGIHFPAADTIAFVEGGVESMRLNSSGNLGLGTSSPLTRLDVRGNVFVGRTDNGNNIIGFGWTSMSGAPDSSPGNAFIVGNSSNAAGGPSNISFWTCTGGTVNERMRIESNGNVGIGTSSPGSRLTVAGTVAITANGGVVSFTTSTAAVDIYGMYVTSTVGTTLNTQSGTAITFNTGVTERMRIDSAGNVGIGTTSPVNKLDISGSFGRGAPVTKTTNFTLAATENWVICNGAGTITVTLPAASSWTGREVMIKTIAAQTVVSASSNVVPLTGGAAGTAILAATAGKWATLVSDGTNWVIMSAA